VAPTCSRAALADQRRQSTIARVSVWQRCVARSLRFLAKRALAFTRYCYYQYCRVYSIQTLVRRGSRILPDNRAIVLHQGGQYRWAGGIKGGLIRAQQPRSETISCTGQGVAGAAPTCSRAALTDQRRQSTSARASVWQRCLARSVRSLAKRARASGDVEGSASRSLRHSRASVARRARRRGSARRRQV